MVGGLVHRGVAVLGLGRRYQQSVLGFPKSYGAQGLPEQLIKGSPVVPIARQQSKTAADPSAVASGETRGAPR